MQPPSSGAGKAKQNEWFSKNHMGKIVCKLCQTEHRDDANFLLHIESKRHGINLSRIARAREIYEKEKESRDRLRSMATHDAHAATIAALGGDGAATTATTAAAGGAALGSSALSKATPRAPTVGRPTVRGPQFEQVQSEFGTICRVFFQLHYPLAASDGISRPMHKWLNTREQSVEPQDDSVIYLVFACNPYDSVAYTFPANAAISEFSQHKTPESYHCEWDPINKTYTLMFCVVNRGD